MKNKARLISILVFLFMAVIGLAQSLSPTGNIKGQVLDKETQSPLPGVNVTILNTQMGAATDSDGAYAISKVPVGSYSLQFSFIGYQKVIKTDIIVKTNRTTDVLAELPFAVLELGDVVVTGGYFSETKDQPLSATNFGYEEIRRSPGSAGDVSRIIAMLPSVAPSTDQSNNLVVRGGNPGENAFYVDNIQIPNINHFPTQGSAGGALGILNVEFIQDVNFYSGGFTAAFADRLSSVMEISFREGNRDRINGQLDLNWAGFGIVGEGPLPGKKGSWLFSARKSYLDVLVKTIDVGNTMAPRYGDIQGKAVYEINQNHKLSLVGVWSDDHNSADKETAIANDMVMYMNQDITQNTTGLNWRALWSKKGFSNTSLSYTEDKFVEDAYDTGTEALWYKNRTTALLYSLRNINSFRFSSRHAIEFGVQGNLLHSNFNNYYGEQQDPTGRPIPPLQADEVLRASKIGAFLSYSVTPLKRLSSTLGVRVDHFSKSRGWNVAPRISLAYQLTPITTLNAAAGIYYQNLPLVLYSQNEAFQELRDTRSTHAILGLTHMLNETTKLTFEIYRKNYDQFPMDPAMPQFFIIDEPFYNNLYYQVHEKLADSGKAYAHGVELMLQKKLAKNFYGLASVSYFRSRYQDYSAAWRNRIFDQRLIASVEGGYKPNNKWEMSLHWIYSGGRPYTPFDIKSSEEANAGIVNPDLVNQGRYPNFNWLNVRIDRRFNFSRTNLVMYISVYNILNRKNVSAYFWNTATNKQETIYQWGALPIFGFEFEF